MKILKDFVEKGNPIICTSPKGLRQEAKEWIKHFIRAYQIEKKQLPTKIQLRNFTEHELRDYVRHIPKKWQNKQIFHFTLDEISNKFSAGSIKEGLAMIAILMYFFGITKKDL